MTRRIIPWIAVLATFALITQEAASQAVHGSYYECDIPNQGRADDIFEDDIAPMLDKHLEAGAITAWGWLGHRNGANWRRLLYIVADDVASLMEGRNVVMEDILNENAMAWNQFSRICGKHDDLIWTRASGSAAPGEVGEDRSSAGMSQYLHCDASRSARLNEIVGVFAETFNAHVANGSITSWGWFDHEFGGPYTRLFTFDGESHAANMAARRAIIDDLNASHPAEVAEFQQICPMHQDYMWDVRMSKP